MSRRNNEVFAEVRRKNPKASRSEFGSLLRSAYAGSKGNPDGGDRPTESNPRGGDLLKWGAIAIGAYFVFNHLNKRPMG
jgi:hypothetical protein